MAGVLRALHAHGIEPVEWVNSVGRRLELSDWCMDLLRECGVHGISISARQVTYAMRTTIDDGSHMWRGPKAT